MEPPVRDNPGQPAPSGLPSISIVVPNYNGGATIGKTLQSLLDQQYPDLELVVVDGGSKDDSVAVIKRYEPHLKWWVSEKDRGQSHAINKGFAHCTGDVVNWLCSDDVFTPGALHTVARCFAAHPDIDVVAGKSEVVFLMDHSRDWLFGPTAEQIALIPCGNPIAQPSCFYRRRLLRQPDPIDESYHYGMDFELWAYFVSRGAKWMCIDDHLSVYYNDGKNKTCTGGIRYVEDFIRVYQTYVHERVPLTFWQKRIRHPMQLFLMRNPRHAQAWRVRRWLARVDRWLGRYYGPQRVQAMDWRWTTVDSRA